MVEMRLAIPNKFELKVLVFINPVILLSIRNLKEKGLPHQPVTLKMGIYP
jgi:hypothetical protein